jgi:glc operon protein GlcG
MSQLPNPYGASIRLEAARRLVAAALDEAAVNGWTVAVAVVDAAGDLVVLERMDGTQVGSVEVAREKARCAVRFKRPTKEWEDALAGGRTPVLGIPGVLPIEGGLPLLDAGGGIVGGVGVSGALPPQDGRCAERAAAVPLPRAT